jgi:S1-C subfamily serine protease
MLRYIIVGAALFTISGCEQMVAMDLSIDSDRVLCQYYEYYPNPIYASPQILINELKRRGISREDCIELTGDEGVYAYGRTANAEASSYTPPEQIEPPSASEKISTTGSGFFVSTLGHVVTNAHVVENCKQISVGDDPNNLAPAKIVSTDKWNDLALLKAASLTPLAVHGLRPDDVKLGENVLVAGYPYGDVFGNTLKVTAGIVSATRGVGDNSAQFQIDAAVQAGNSGGPIYDSGGNIVGVVVSQLDKLKIAQVMGTLPENVNFGIKASTVKSFLHSSGLSSQLAEQTTAKTTVELAEIARKQTLIVFCDQ